MQFPLSLESPLHSSSLSIEDASAPVARPEVKLLSRRSLLLSAALVGSLLVALVVLLCVLLPSSSSATVPYGRPAGQSSLWQPVPSDSSSPGSSSRAAPSAAHTFHWLFPQRNLDWLHSEFAALTMPSSPRFQQWHTHASLMAQIAPPAADKLAVTSWLLSQGVEASSIKDLGDTFEVNVTVGVVEGLFRTEMLVQQHSKTGQQATVSKDEQVQVPASLSHTLKALKGVYDFPHSLMHLHTFRTNVPKRSAMPLRRRNATAATQRFRPMQKEESNAQCRSVSEFYPLVSPLLLSAAYNFALRNAYTSAQKTISMVTSFGGQAFSTVDLTQYNKNIGFSASFNPDIINPSTNSANLQSYGYGVEASLDIEVLSQIAPTETNQFYASTASGSLLGALQSISAMAESTRPQVVSISYTFAASDYQYYESDQGDTETQLMIMGTSGITVVAAAGDDGTAGSYNRGCSSSPNSLGYGTVSPLASPMVPSYPASSQYVLSVGETDFLKSASTESAAVDSFSPIVTSPPECNNCPSKSRGVGFLCQATSLGEEPVSYGNQNGFSSQTTGGGFSLVFEQPDWQQAAVTNYLNSACAPGNSNGCTLPSSTLYYAGHRAYPDVSAFGGYFAIVADGEETVGGTSVAAPLVAGLISRLNEVNMEAPINGPALGFVNPLLYSIAASNPSAFNDITVGENACPQTNSACASFYQTGSGSTTCSGFHAAPGWDPVTGLGSLNVGAVIDYLTSQ